jgi:hypothetical protein
MNKGFPNQHYSRFLHVKRHEHYAHRKNNSLQLNRHKAGKFANVEGKFLSVTYS